MVESQVTTYTSAAKSREVLRVIVRSDKPYMETIGEVPLITVTALDVEEQAKRKLQRVAVITYVPGNKYEAGTLIEGFELESEVKYC